MCNKLLQWKLKGVQKHQTSEATHYSKKKKLQGECPFTSTTAELTLAPSKCCSIPQRQCNQPSMDVLIEIRQACFGHNVVPSTSGARPSGRRQRVRSVAEQVRSLNCNRHGLLCRCQHQRLPNVSGHYNVRLFKLSRRKDGEISTNFPLRFVLLVLHILPGPGDCVWLRGAPFCCVLVDAELLVSPRSPQSSLPPALRNGGAIVFNLHRPPEFFVKDAHTDRALSRKTAGGGWCWGVTGRREGRRSGGPSQARSKFRSPKCR